MVSLNFFFYVKQKQEIKAIGYDFLLGYLGLYIGFALTIYTYIIGGVGRISEKVEQKNLFKGDKEKEEKFFNSIRNGLREFKEDTYIIVGAYFVVCFFLLFDYAVQNVDFLKGIKEAYSNYYISETVRLSVLLTSVLAAYDLVKGMFSVTELMQLADLTKPLKEPKEPNA